MIEEATLTRMREIVSKTEPDTHGQLLRDNSSPIATKMTINAKGMIVPARKAKRGGRPEWFVWCTICEKGIGSQGLKTWEQANALLEVHRADCSSHPPDSIEIHCFINWAAATG